MTGATDLRTQALAYHRNLPERIRDYLRHERGIADEVIDLHSLGWNGQRITIPIIDRNAQVVAFKFAKDPADASHSPKMLTTPGARAELYGWERVLVKPERIVICEGEFDRLVLETHGFAAVTSTCGAGVFRQEWAEELKNIPEVYVCFDRDDAGRNGALRAGRMIPHAKLVELPDEVGEAGDVTDFFVRLGRSREDFLHLLASAPPAPAIVEPEFAGIGQDVERRKANGEVEQLKSRVSIENMVGRHIPLRQKGKNLVGRCPFHDDRIPSFVVFPATQSFYCFGCRVHGDVAGFLMRIENLTFPEALRALRELTN
jgi:DNA primase